MLKHFYPKRLLVSFTLLSAVFILNSCKSNNDTKTLTLKKIEGKQIAIDEHLKNDSEIDLYVTPYRQKIDEQMNEVLAYAPITLDNERDQDETLLGNFMADLCYDRAFPVFNKQTGKQIDFTLLNIGGLRAYIDKGSVKIADAYEVMPFENVLVVAELDYNTTNELLQYLAQSNTPHPISKHLNVVFDRKHVKKALLNGKPFDKHKTYHVLTNDYLLNGGNNMSFFKNAKKVYHLDYKVRDALVDKLKAIDTIKVVLDQRMVRP